MIDFCVIMIYNIDRNRVHGSKRVDTLTALSYLFSRGFCKERSMNTIQLQIPINNDQEIFVPIKGYENSYLISNKGRIFSKLKNKMLKPGNSKGYMSIQLFKNGICETKRIGRLVLINFVPNPYNKPECNHVNGIRNDDRVCNLEWATRKENQNHALRTGLKKHFSQEKLKKHYEITFPDGHKEIIFGLRVFCREHNLNEGNMSNLATGKINKYKGYGCNEI